MQKLGSLSSWELLKKDEFIRVPVTNSRRSTLETNSEEYVSLYYYPMLPGGGPDESHGAVFLARVIGVEEIRFMSPIPIVVVADAPCSVRTMLGQKVYSYEASESFTRIVERRAVNPDVLAVTQRANANQRAMIRAMDVMQQSMHRMEQANAKTVIKPISNSGDDVEAPKPQPNVSAGASPETRELVRRANRPKSMTSDTYSQARSVMVRPEFASTQKWREQQSRADRKGAHEDILHFEKALIRRMRSMGIPMFSHCVMRSREQQQVLYLLKKTKAKPGESPHQYGGAVDIVHSTMAWDLPNPKCWEMIGVIGHEVAQSIGVKVVWGGSWDFWDPAHWQLEDWKNLK